MNLKKLNQGLLLLAMLSGYSYASDTMNLMNEDGAVSQKVRVGEESREIVAFFRKGLGKEDSVFNADYLYLWHGYDQDAYSFLNVTGFTKPKYSSYRPLFVFGVSSTDFLKSEVKSNSRLIELYSAGYRNKLKPRKSISIGYDLGVAQAYNHACTSGINRMVLSSGGVFTTENCEPKSTKVFYSVNTYETVFPYDKANTFTTERNYSLDVRLDGQSTVKRLRDLLGCHGPAVNKPVRKGQMMEYLCANDNSLVVLKNNSSDHQWNGYTVALEGTFNQYGSPFAPSMYSWIEQIHGVR
ncbi:TPA: hypothetical protein I7730_14435 [Vibrio vulnificus]|uniref:Uncharacterized protein n=1 Tax=Vibrio vulnificus TaxID=672 RepID=A0A8H9TG99_VIBVL|nr:hypothetical protein [Vibrio vulnificus]HAS8540985.1 hypothetical protein [Vibrio vulnificus]